MLGNFADGVQVLHETTIKAWRKDDPELLASQEDQLQKEKEMREASEERTTKLEGLARNVANVELSELNGPLSLVSSSRKNIRACL